MQVVITTTMYMCVCVFVSFCAVTIFGYVEHLCNLKVMEVLSSAGTVCRSCTLLQVLYLLYNFL